MKQESAERDPVNAPPAETLPRSVDHRVPNVFADSLHGAFVAGAKWWEFASTKGTMWASDRDLAWAEAEKRYGPLPDDALRAEPPPVPTAEGAAMSIVDDTALQARIAALEAKLQTAEQERDEWRDAFEKTSWNAGVELLKVEGALKQRDTRIAALEATLTQIRALPRSHRASTYEHLGRYEAGPFVRADELDRLLNALPETPKKSD